MRLALRSWISAIASLFYGRILKLAQPFQDVEALSTTTSRLPSSLPSPSMACNTDHSLHGVL